MPTDAEAIATGVVEMARSGRFREIEDLFAPRLKAVVSAEALQTAWTTEMTKHGPVSSVGRPMAVPGESGLIRVTIAVSCEHGGLTVVMSVDDVGRLQGLRLASSPEPTWSAPSYAATNRFREQEVTVGSGDFAVPGTLSRPRGRGIRPGIVLLSGGGPFDRDETSGPNKPLKDLAWGLASRGVAVLRFDKVTYTYGAQLADSKGFTMSEEYVPHAVAALRLLRELPGVDPGRVFILGHSMGGKVAPRVATADPTVAGLVIMAGDTQPMQRAAVRVARYLASLTRDPSAEAAVAMISRQAEAVESDQLSASTPARDLPFGLSAAYWLDLRAYDPVAVAAALDKPMLILQGGRDYQVTVEDDLSGWQRGLAQRPDVSIRVFDAADHLFFAGVGPSTPADYEIPQHVDAAVVANIAEWLIPHSPKPAS